MFYIFLFLLLFSCSHYYQETAVQLQNRRFEEAEKKLAKADLPYTSSNDAALLSLSRAMVYFQSGQFLKSTHDFEKALDATDYYKQTSLPEMVGQTLLQDDIAAYVPPPFEEHLARFYQALAFLHIEQEDNAAATLHYLENHDKQNPLTTYLLAALFERRGDSSNAKILYSRLQVTPTNGNVLLIHHRGSAPQKRSVIAKTSIVSAALLETLLKVQDVKPALSTLTGVPVPELVTTARPTATLSIDHHAPLPMVSFDVALAAEEQLDKEMPWTAARAAARILIRRGVVASTKEKKQPLMDFAMLISNLATQADTRSWTTLPSRIDLYHLNLDPGKHQIQVGKEVVHVQVKPKGLTILEIFQPSSNNLFNPKENT